MENIPRLPPFTVTPAAIAMIEALGGDVRLDVVEGGCSGHAFEFAAATPPPAAALHGATPWERFGCPGAWLHVHRRALEVLDAAVVDYSERIRPPRFRILRIASAENPCPSKRSFGEPWPGPGSPRCRSYLPMPWDRDYDPPARWKRQTGYGA